MTSNRIIETARKKLLELTTDVIDDTSMFDYLNAVNLDLKIRVFPNNDVKTETVTLTGGVGNLPTDFGTLYADAYNASGDVFAELSIADFNRELVGNAITIESGTLKVKPTTTTSIIIKYYTKAETLSTIIDPTIPEYFQELMVWGILARAYEDLQDEVLSKYYDEKYEAKLTAKMSNYSNFEEGNQRGGTMFTDIQII
jgi:hypothetical protein